MIKPWLRLESTSTQGHRLNPVFHAALDEAVAYLNEQSASRRWWCSSRYGELVVSLEFGFSPEWSFKHVSHGTACVLTMEGPHPGGSVVDREGWCREAILLVRRVVDAAALVADLQRLEKASLEDPLLDRTLKAADHASGLYTQFGLSPEQTLVEVHIPVSGAAQGTTSDAWMPELDMILTQLQIDGELAVLHEGGMFDGHYVLAICGSDLPRLLELVGLLVSLPGVPSRAFAVIADSSCEQFGQGTRVPLPTHKAVADDGA